ncbi:hypothetical protein MP228_008848 [Amoeboaphelidium protococcarum]|nr:hypothetical protein MP228_008848 [Amoeboaphelidium protococcarum]
MINTILFGVCLVASISCVSTNQKYVSAVVAGEFIVALNVPATVSSSESFIDEHLNRVFGLIASAESSHNPVMHKYSFGYAAKMDDQLVEMVRAMPEVDVVEPNYIAHIFAEQHSPRNWGLIRSSQRSKISGQTIFTYPDHAGNRTTVYIIDTGVDTQHSEFKKANGTVNARFGTSFVYGGDKGDQNGHGTHVGTTV